MKGAEFLKLIFEENIQVKEKGIREVLTDLPEWFGIESSLDEYVTNCQNYPSWLAVDNEEVLGFISLKETSKVTAEIYCMGIKKDFHRKGIGVSLYKEFENYALNNQYRFLQVKTVAEGKYLNYDQTINFYRKLGFSELEVFPTLWDEWNPCLVLVKSL